MKALVTGGCGFVGSHVVDQLLASKYEVSVIDDLSTGTLENLDPTCTFIFNSVENKDLWEGLGKCDFVFHLAALARIQPSIQNPRPSHEVNLDGTFNVLEYCRKHNAKLVFSSSSSLYTGDKLPSGELDHIEAKNPYTLQKQVCEQYIELYHKLYGLDYAILRYFNVFGERQILTGAYAAITGIFQAQKAAHEPLTITFDGEQRRDFTYVKDVARANLMAINWQGTFNVGTGTNHSINELAELIGGEKKYIGDREGETRETLADISKIEKMGWRPSVGIEQWLA